MKVLYAEKEMGKDVCIALGAFDGVHKAHKEILTACADYAKENKLHSYAYTFENNPYTKGDEEAEPQLLTSLEEKLELIGKTGIENVIVRKFDKRFASSKADAFIKRICKGKRVKAIFCGYDYRFGKGAEGDVEMLQSMAEEMGYQLFVHEAVLVDGQPVSSTRIREAMESGNIALAVEMLDRPIEVCMRDYSRKQAGEDGFVYGLLIDGYAIKDGSYEGYVDMDGEEIPAGVSVYKNTIRLQLPWVQLVPRERDLRVLIAKGV